MSKCVMKMRKNYRRGTEIISNFLKTLTKIQMLDKSCMINKWEKIRELNYQNKLSGKIIKANYIENQKLKGLLKLISKIECSDLTARICFNYSYSGRRKKRRELSQRVNQSNNKRTCKLKRSRQRMLLSKNNSERGNNCTVKHYLTKRTCNNFKSITMVQ